jgi:ABC-2 type transport system ATP-binding protein
MQALVLRQLTKTYKNGIKALKGIDLEVERAISSRCSGPTAPARPRDRHRHLAGQQDQRHVEVFGHDIDRELERPSPASASCRRKSISIMFETAFTIVVNQAGFYGIPRPLANSAPRSISSSCSCGTGAIRSRAPCRAA